MTDTKEICISFEGDFTEANVEASQQIVEWWLATPEKYRPLVRSSAVDLGVKALEFQGITTGSMSMLYDTVGNAVTEIDSISLSNVLNHIAAMRAARGEN